MKSAPNAFIFCTDLDACLGSVHAKFQVASCSGKKDMGKIPNSPSPQKTNSPSPKEGISETRVLVATPPVLAGVTPPVHTASPPVQMRKPPQSLMHGTHFGHEDRVTPTMHGCFAQLLVHMLAVF